MGFLEDKVARDLAWAQDTERRHAEQVAGGDGVIRGNEVKKSQDEAQEAVIVRQAENARVDTTGYSGGIPGEKNFARPEWFQEEPLVLKLVETPPTVEKTVYELGSFEIGPRRGGPDVPMEIPFRGPPIGALMVFVGRTLLMTMPFDVGTGPVEMKRLYQVPRNSKAYVRIHTGRGTLQPGQSIATRPRSDIQPPGGSYGSGEPDWMNLPRDLNDLIGTGLRERFLWWFDTFMDEWGLFGKD